MAQPEPSVREAERLLTVGQFFVRVLDLTEPLADSAAVDQACTLITVAEIMTRWSAIQRQRHSTVDG